MPNIIIRTESGQAVDMIPITGEYASSEQYINFALSSVHEAINTALQIERGEVKIEDVVSPIVRSIDLLDKLHSDPDTFEEEQRVFYNKKPLVHPDCTCTPLIEEDCSHCQKEQTRMEKAKILLDAIYKAVDKLSSEEDRREFESAGGHVHDWVLAYYGYTCRNCTALQSDIDEPKDDPEDFTNYNSSSTIEDPCYWCEAFDD